MQIKSKILKQELTFSRPGTGYIYVDINGRPGTLGKQICRGGGFTGSTLSCSGTEERFEDICRSWYRAYLKDYKRTTVVSD